MSVVWLFKTYPKQDLSTGILFVVFRSTVTILEKLGFSPSLKGLNLNSGNSGSVNYKIINCQASQVVTYLTLFWQTP